MNLKKRDYYLWIPSILFFISIVFFYFALASSNNKVADLQNRNITLKQTISLMQKQDETVVKLYRQELKLWKEKQKILDWLPFVNTKLYLKGELQINDIRKLDDKILEKRTTRLQEEKKLFPYREGLDM